MSSNSQTLSVRINSDNIRKLDALAGCSGTTRSGTVGKIVETYFTQKHCAKCYALNDEAGKVCCVCGTTLFNDIELLMGIMLAVPRSRNDELLQKEPWSKYLADGLLGEVYPSIKRSFGKPDEYLIKVRFTTQSGLPVLPVENPVVMNVDKDRVLDFAGVARKRFEGNPTARAEFMEQYKLA